MTTAPDHKNNLNRSTTKKTYSRTLRVETIANSAGGTAAVAMVAHSPAQIFLNSTFMRTDPYRRHRRLLGANHGRLTKSKSLTIVVSPLDMIGLIGMAQVLATSPMESKVQENTSQMERWSLNQAPTWTPPPLTIANRHDDTNNQLVQNTQYDTNNQLVQNTTSPCH